MWLQALKPWRVKHISDALLQSQLQASRQTFSKSLASLGGAIGGMIGWLVLVALFVIYAITNHLLCS
jgi:hypothetical protein